MAASFRGKLIKWNDHRGFGFIEPEHGGPDVFVHARVFRSGDRRPEEGARVLYKLDEESERPKASSARLRGLTVTQLGILGYSLLGVAWSALFAYTIGWIELPWPIVVYLMSSLFTFTAYWCDKKRAEASDWRVTESALHAFEVLGGWPGALVAQATLRHKTRKYDYRVVLWAIIGVHVAALTYWACGGAGSPT